MARPKRADGLDSHSRAARRARGKALKTITVPQAVVEELDDYITAVGFANRADCLRFLLANRPEAQFAKQLVDDPAFLSDEEDL